MLISTAFDKTYGDYGYPHGFKVLLSNFSTKKQQKKI